MRVLRNDRIKSEKILNRIEKPTNRIRVTTHIVQTHQIKIQKTMVDLQFIRFFLCLFVFDYYYYSIVVTLYTSDNVVTMNE